MNLEAEVVKICQDLIRIPSVNFGEGKGDEKAVAEYIVSSLAEVGIASEIFESAPNRCNVIARLPGRDATRPGLVVHGHIDVVPANADDWSVDPFAAEIRDGMIWGRGAVDMKCAVACFMSAVEDFLQHHPEPDFGIGFLITNDEEADSINGTKKVLKWMVESGKKMTHCIVGEPTNPQVFGEMMKIGRRGSINFKVKITGKQGHVAYPEHSLNPTTILVSLLKLLQDHKFDNGNQFFDPTHLEVTAISSQNLGNNVIPNEAEANFNVRFNNMHTSESVIELVEYACKKSAEGLGAKYALTYRTSGESFLSQPKKLAETLTKAVEKVCGKTPVQSTTGGTSDARFIKDHAEVVEFGLINTTAHQINEYTSVEDILKLQETYLEVLKNFN